MVKCQRKETATQIYLFNNAEYILEMLFNNSRGFEI